MTLKEKGKVATKDNFLSSSKEKKRRPPHENVPAIAERKF